MILFASCSCFPRYTSLYGIFRCFTTAGSEHLLELSTFEGGVCVCFFAGQGDVCCSHHGLSHWLHHKMCRDMQVCSTE